MPNGRLTRRQFLKVSSLSLMLLGAPGPITGYSLSLTKLDLGFGRRILFLPDIHLHGGDRGYLVELVGRVKPDILILGGDTWDMLSKKLYSIEGDLADLVRGAKWIIAVLGNHEYTASSRGSHPLDEGVGMLEDMGVYVLRDDSLEVGGLRIGGLDWRDDPRRYEESSKQLGHVDIVVSHSPDSARHVVQRNTVILAGHTHGGQICLPGSASVITNSVYGFKWGWYKVRSNNMYVSRGVGEMIPPRVYCGREAVLVY